MKKYKKHITSLKEYIKDAESRAKYSIERFDILIISLSSGGIALSFGIIEKYINTNKDFVLYGCVFFSLALVINLLSQVTGYYANRFDIKYSNEEIRKIEGKNFKADYEIYDCYSSFFSNITMIFNGISLISLIIAIVYLLLFITNLKP